MVIKLDEYIGLPEQLLFASGYLFWRRKKNSTTFSRWDNNIIILSEALNTDQSKVISKASIIIILFKK